MPESKSTAKRRRAKTTRSKPVGARATKQPIEKNATEEVVTQVTDAIKTVVNIPVGLALEAADKITEAFEPFKERESAEKELRKFRTDLRRSLKRYDRRGNKITNLAKRQVSKRRNEVKRHVTKRRTEARRTVKGARTSVKRRRRTVETRVKRGRRQAETQIKRGQKQAEKLQNVAQDVVSGQSDVAQRIVGEVTDQVDGVRQQLRSVS